MIQGYESGGGGHFLTAAGGGVAGFEPAFNRVEVEQRPLSSFDYRRREAGDLGELACALAGYSSAVSDLGESDNRREDRFCEFSVESCRGDSTKLSDVDGSERGCCGANGIGCALNGVDCGRRSDGHGGVSFCEVP